MFLYVGLLFKFGIQLSSRYYNSIIKQTMKAEEYELLQKLLESPKMLELEVDLVDPFFYCRTLRMARFLYDKLASISIAALRAWIQRGNPELVTFFLDRKKDDFSASIEPLHLAIDYSSPLIFDILLTSNHFIKFADPVYLLDERIIVHTDRREFMAVLKRCRLRFFWVKMRLLLLWMKENDNFPMMDPFTEYTAPFMLQGNHHVDA